MHESNSAAQRREVIERPHLFPRTHGELEELLWIQMVEWENSRAESQKWNASIFMTSYYGQPIGNHHRSCQRHHSEPRTASALECLFATPTENCNRYYLRNGKATEWKFGRYIRRVHSYKGPLTMETRKLSCRKDDRTMRYRPTVYIISAPWKFSGLPETLTRPYLRIAKFLLCFCSDSQCPNFSSTPYYLRN